MKNNNEGIEKVEKTEWMDVGFQGIIFKIPKEYNHQLVKDAEILMKHFYNSGEKSKEKEMLDKFEKVIDEEIVICDICKKYPENNCIHPCCKNNKKLKERLQKLKGAERK